MPLTWLTVWTTPSSVMVSAMSRRDSGRERAEGYWARGEVEVARVVDVVVGLLEIGPAEVGLRELGVTGDGDIEGLVLCAASRDCAGNGLFRVMLKPGPACETTSTELRETGSPPWLAK